jgi:RND superfamily putative drug exporter
LARVLPGLLDQSAAVLSVTLSVSPGAMSVSDAQTIINAAAVPLFMFAVLFGLSMDYEVFLVSQIKEHADAGEDAKRSVVSGLVTSGRVITAAATIMVFVFGSFVLNGDPTVKQFGIGLAAAVILDATVVRCRLVPARMARLGKANWYLPRWLSKVLPRLNIEGEEYFKARDQASPIPQLQAPEATTARS